MFNMSGELESGKSGNVIMAYIYCPEENDIAHRSELLKEKKTTHKWDNISHGVKNMDSNSDHMILEESDEKC